MPPTPPDNKRYTGLAWGTGAVALNYTAPRRALRITGAQPGPHHESLLAPTTGWGTHADDAFFRTECATGMTASTQHPPHEIYDLLIGSRRKEATVAFAADHLRHYSPMVRTWAARSLTNCNDAASIDALVDASRHDDPRVRRAAYDAISGYDNWRRPGRSKVSSKIISERFLPAIAKTLADPASAWWEIDGALFALGRAEPNDIREYLHSIKKFTQHHDWYLRDAAFWALVGLGDTIQPHEFDLLARIYCGSRHVFERSSYDAGFKQLLRRDKVAFERNLMNRSVRLIGRMMHEPQVMLGYGTGGIHEAAHRTMMLLKHFDPEVFEVMVDDFVTYLDRWTPYYQHSVWLITGSKWQPGILKVVEGLGAKAKPIVTALERAADRFSDFDPKRIGKAGKNLEPAMRATIEAFRDTHGR